MSDFIFDQDAMAEHEARALAGPPIPDVHADDEADALARLYLGDEPQGDEWSEAILFDAEGSLVSVDGDRWEIAG